MEDVAVDCCHGEGDGDGEEDDRQALATSIDGGVNGSHGDDDN